MKFETHLIEQHPRSRMEQATAVLVEIDGEMVHVGTIQPQTTHLKNPNLWVSSSSALTPPGSPGWMTQFRVNPPLSWLAPLETSDEDIARWLLAGWGLGDDPPPDSPEFSTLAQRGLFGNDNQNIKK